MAINPTGEGPTRTAGGDHSLLSFPRQDALFAAVVEGQIGEAGKTAPDPFFGGEGPDRTGCLLCGRCMVGCVHGAKNTLVKNYLYFAEKRGARVMAERTVVDVRPLGPPDGSEGYEVVTAKHRHIGNGRAMIIGETEGLVKVIAEKQPDGTGGRILGVHMVGPWVTEQLGQGYLAVNWEATVDEVAHFIQPHPTMSELFGETMMSLTGRSLH